MKIRLFILLGLLFVGQISAQNMKLDIQSVSIEKKADSTIISFHMAVNVSELDAKNQIKLVPILMNNHRTAELPAVILNGKKAQNMYLRSQAMLKRKGKGNGGDTNTYTVIGLAGSNEKHSITYRTSLPSEDWLSQAKLVMKKELNNEKGTPIQSETISVPGKNNYATPYQAEPQLAESTPVAPDLRQDAVPVVVPFAPATAALPSLKGKRYAGSYLSPESDATDERNQKELNFSLDEARVVVDVKPEMLSLRELYTVALSYKSNPRKFYEIIEKSVKIYPASPIANLNAAAAAIEQGDVPAAGRYLQMASHENVAYKNCRGAYELLCNNTYEGIRLLKAAQAEGSEEATQNLKLFFESNRQAQ